MTKIFKNYLLVFLLAVTSLTLIACSGDEDNEVLTDKAEEFVLSVEDIGEVSLQSKDKLTISSRLYNYLSKAETEFKKVISSKKTLDEKQDQYDKLVEENLDEEDYEKEKDKIEKFINEVNSLPVGNNLSKVDRASIEYSYDLYSLISSNFQAHATVLEAYNKLEAAKVIVDKLCADDDLVAFKTATAKLKNVSLNNGVEVALLTSMFNDLSDSVKELSGYEEAKEDYLVVYNKYHELKNTNDTTIFLGYISNLENVTLGSLETINYATSKYNEMSEDAKSQASVVEGKSKLDSALNTYNELYAADQAYKVAKIIELVDLLPEVDNVGKSEYNTLYDIEVLYSGLAFNSQMLAEVRSAYATFKLAKEKFDSYGFAKIEGDVVNVSIGTGSKPGLSISNGSQSAIFKQILLENFNISSSSWSEIQAKLIENNVYLTLHVYMNGSKDLVGSITIDYIDLSFSGASLTYDKTVLLLQELSLTNPNIVSGATYSFAMNFVDSTDELIPSTLSFITDESSAFIWG